MMQFTVMPHVADVRLRAEGDTTEDVFRAALQGMNSLLWTRPMPEGEPVIREINITSPDTTALLVDFLSEVLTLSQTEHAVFIAVKFAQFEPTMLSATLHGIAVPAFDEDIKAVTYHEAEVKRDDGIWTCTVIFDI